MKKLIGVGVIVAGVWSLIPWGFFALISLIGALLPDPGSIISFKFPWWAVAIIWAAEPVLWLLLWAGQKSRAGLGALTLFVGFWVGLGLVKGVSILLLYWLGPTLLLIPFLFWYHRGASSSESTEP